MLGQPRAGAMTRQIPARQGRTKQRPPRNFSGEQASLLPHSLFYSVPGPPHMVLGTVALRGCGLREVPEALTWLLRFNFDDAGGSKGREAVGWGRGLWGGGGAVAQRATCAKGQSVISAPA